MSTLPAIEAHPLVQAYMTDLNHAMLGADPRERADVFDGVREYLREALADDAALESVRVRQALAGLGSVESIAAQATTVSPHRTVGSDATSLVALLVAIAAAALVFIPFVSIPLAIAALVTSAIHLRRPGANRRMSWAALWVAVASLLITIIAGASLLMVSFDNAPNTPSPATTLSTE